MADDIELPDPDGYVGDQSKPGAPLRPAYLARTVRRLLAEQGAHAARYRWLRAQHWSDNTISVVIHPKDAIKLGHDAPSLDRLDAAIDAAMQDEREGGDHGR